MLVQAEISLYPLREADLAPVIYAFLRRLERPGLTLEPGPLSTLVSGEHTLIFTALGEALEAVGLLGSQALVLKMLHLRAAGEE